MKSIREPVWRNAALDHQRRIRLLLQDGLTPQDHPLNAGHRKHRSKRTGWTALDPKNPVYNFLIEYYGLKGSKGPRRLARWSPSFLDVSSTCNQGSPHSILLENATEEDLGSLLHARGAEVSQRGVHYCPARFFGKGGTAHQDASAKAATAYLWYRAVLNQTLTAEPILHCYGLHEFAMIYHPTGGPEPPSAKYQSHLPLRVSRQVINDTVERRGVSCTHVDALRFFAPAAACLNHHGATLERTDQLRLEQPACVHAHMDLLKIALKLQPFGGGADLLVRVLEVALDARKIDVAASPYDASEYGVHVVPVETASGRALYKKKQRELMKRAEPIRRDLLRSYDAFIEQAFDEYTLRKAMQNPAVVRFARAEPGGEPWYRNLIGS